MLPQSVKEKLKKLYEEIDTPSSFSGANALYREAVKRGINVSQKDVKDFLLTVATHGAFQHQRKRFLRSKGAF